MDETPAGEYVPVYTTFGSLSGEMIRLLLESFGIPAMLSQESAGAVYGLTIGSLGEVYVLVPAERQEDAEAILAAMEAGQLETSAPADSVAAEAESPAPDEQAETDTEPEMPDDEEE